MASHFGDTTLVTAGIEPVLASVDSRIVASLSSLDEMVWWSQPVVFSSLTAFVASAIGLIGLLLAMTCIYGIISYIVVLRTREVGTRMAIGAQKRDVLGLILRESARPVMAGLITGIVLAVGTSYLLRGFVYGITGVDVVKGFERPGSSRIPAASLPRRLCHLLCCSMPDLSTKTD